MLLYILARLLYFIGYVCVWTGSLGMLISGAVHYSKTGNENLLFFSCAWVAVIMYFNGFSKDDQK